MSSSGYVDEEESSDADAVYSRVRIFDSLGNILRDWDRVEEYDWEGERSLTLFLPGEKSVSVTLGAGDRLEIEEV